MLTLTLGVSESEVWWAGEDRVVGAHGKRKRNQPELRPIHLAQHIMSINDPLGLAQKITNNRQQQKPAWTALRCQGCSPECRISSCTPLLSGPPSPMFRPLPSSISAKATSHPSYRLVSSTDQSLSGILLATAYFHRSPPDSALLGHATLLQPPWLTLLGPQYPLFLLIAWTTPTNCMQGLGFRFEDLGFRV